MKSIRSFFVTSVLAVCALFVIDVNQNAYGRNVGGGRLIIQRAPTLGHNVRIDVVIDGQLAGLLSRGRTFDSYIPPGRHLLIANPNGWGSEWSGVLDVRPGDVYNFMVTYNVDRLALNPIINGRY